MFSSLSFSLFDNFIEHISSTYPLSARWKCLIFKTNETLQKVAHYSTSPVYLNRQYLHLGILLLVAKVIFRLYRINLTFSTLENRHWHKNKNVMLPEKTCKYVFKSRLFISSGPVKRAFTASSRIFTIDHFDRRLKLSAKK